MKETMSCGGENYDLVFLTFSRWENENAEKSPDSGAKSCFFRHFWHHYRAFGKWNLLSMRYPASDTLYAIVF